MSDSSVNNSGAMVLEEPEGRGGSGGREQGQAPVRGGALRCGTCALWPRQQTWLCVVPLLIGFIGLGLSLMLLKWIVVGSVRDYVPTDLVDAKGIGQDPIFLSKPSTFPKGSDTTTTTTTIGVVSSISSTVTTVVRGRTRTGSPPNIPARGGGASGSQVTQKSPTRSVTHNPTFTTTVASTTTSTVQTSTSNPSPSNPTVLNDSTQMWTREQSSTERHVTMPGRTHVSRKTPLPTLPPLKSEHFKPCQEKDLAYCLNDGECFVIETLSGPHKHCRCKDGFQGIRCDQFLPKTDSILSDPMDHLGIEFMESKEVHTRQVMSITCIAMGISFLGTLCMALYCRNKRQREKLQAHLKESRSQKNYNLNSSSLAPKPSLRLQQGQQLQKYYKPTNSSPPYGGTVRESSFTQNTASSSYPQGRHPRSSSLSHSPDQSCHPALRSASRKTPTITRGCLSAIGGSRDSGPAYKHLQELDNSERESVRRNILGPVNDLNQDSFYNMQASQSSKSWSGHLDHRSVRSLRSGPSSQCPPAPYRPGSIPIIPSVHSYQNEVSCMQTASINGSSHSSTSLESTVDGSAVIQQSNATMSNRVSGRRAEVAFLLDKVQEQLRALAHAQRKQEDIGGSIPHGAKETVCILLANGDEQGLVASVGPTETQLVSPRDTHKYATKPGQ